MLANFPCTDDDNQQTITFRTIDIFSYPERTNSRSAESILSNARRFRQGLKIYDD